jgi:DNA-binding IclR family transcriptional regulator
MKSLNKTLDTLEFILNMDGAPSTPGEIASGIGINSATCSRILGDLLERGYVERVSRREGYIPGPALYAMGFRRSPYARLARAAEGPVHELAERLSSVINIAVMRGGFRYMLYFHAAKGIKRFDLRTRYFDDNYITATGRLLMSVAPESEVDFIIEKLGFPNERWDGVTDKDSLSRALRETAAAGTVKYPQDGIWILGVLVRADGCPPAAIGFGVKTKEAAAEAFALMKKAAAGIESALSIKSDSKTFLY